MAKPAAPSQLAPSEAPVASLVSSVILQHEGRYLLLKEQDFDGSLALGIPGGHVKVDEDPLSAAHREMREETGFEVNLKGLHALVSRTYVRGSTVFFVFSATMVGGSPVPEEGSELVWLTKEEFETFPLKRRGLVDEIMQMVFAGARLPADAFGFFDRRSGESIRLSF